MSEGVRVSEPVCLVAACVAIISHWLKLFKIVTLQILNLNKLTNKIVPI